MINICVKVEPIKKTVCFFKKLKLKASDNYDVKFICYKKG
jgi:hypothetical protein